MKYKERNKFIQFLCIHRQVNEVVKYSSTGSINYHKPRKICFDCGKILKVLERD